MEADQTPRYAASDLVLHCLPMSHEMGAWLLWVKLMFTGCLQFVIVVFPDHTHLLFLLAFYHVHSLMN